MLSLAVKEMTFFKLRYLLIGFILFFVAALVFIVSGLANGLAMDNASSIKNSKGTFFYIQKDAEGRLDRSHFNVDDETIQSVKGDIQPLSIQMSTLLNLKNDKKVDVTFMAIQPDSFLAPEKSKGKTLVGSKRNTIVVNETLKKEGIQLGDKLKDSRTNQVVTVIGFTKNQTYSHTPVAFMTTETYRSFSNEGTNLFVMSKEDLSSQQAFSKKVKGGTWVEMKTLIKGIPGYEAEQSSLTLMLSFLIVIAAFILGAFFYIMTIQKLNQFGIMKAIGTKSSFLVGTTLIQVCLLAVIGIGAAFGLTKILISLLPDGIPFLFDVVIFGKYALVLFVVSILGSLLSSINIIKADPIQAMGRVE